MVADYERTRITKVSDVSPFVLGDLFKSTIDVALDVYVILWQRCKSSIPNFPHDTKYSRDRVNPTTAIADLFPALHHITFNSRSQVTYETLKAAKAELSNLYTRINAVSGFVASALNMTRGDYKKLDNTNGTYFSHGFPNYPGTIHGGLQALDDITQDFDSAIARFDGLKANDWDSTIDRDQELLNTVVATLNDVNTLALVHVSDLENGNIDINFTAGFEDDPGIDSIRLSSHVGAELCNYHGGMSSPLYSVGSRAFADHPVDMPTLIGAIDELSDYYRITSGRLDIDDLEDHVYGELSDGLDGCKALLGCLQVVLERFALKLQNRIENKKAVY